jgi:uncharacterized protein YgbK (DUF1537 family)
MRQGLAVISSDLNGAIGTAVPFANCGARVTLYLGSSELKDCDVDVAVLSTNSKLVSARHAYNKTRYAIRKCKGRKIILHEDSSLKGNIASTIKAAIDELNPQKVIICLSIPEKNRYVQNGKVYVEGLPADESELARDMLIYRNTGIKSMVLGFDIVGKSPEAIIKSISRGDERVIVCDAKEKHHFQNIARAIEISGESWFICGSRPLVTEMTYIYGYTCNRLIPIRPQQNKKPVLVIVGNYDPITGKQLNRASRTIGLPLVSIEPAWLFRLNSRESRINAYAERVIQIIGKGNNVAITSNGSKFIPQLKYRTAELLAEIGLKIIQRGDIGALFTCGSDMTYAVCRALQVSEMQISGSINPGISTIISRMHINDGRMLYMGSKGGALGGDDEIVKAIEILRQTHHDKLSTSSCSSRWASGLK